MRLLHAADLHLDSAYGMTRWGDNTDKAAEDERQVLIQLVDLTLELQPDALLLAGDLFHVPYLKAETKRLLNQQFKRLGATPVLIAPGNHDPYPAYRPLRLPENVRVFSHRWAPADVGSGLVWGYGHFDAEEPASVIARLRVRDRRRVNAVLFHGSDLGGKQGPHQRFAAFTHEELEETGADYFALGHIHWASRIDRSDGRLLGCYPGAIRGLNSGAKGNIGVVLATVTKRGTTQETYIGTPNGFVPGDVAFAASETV